MKHRSTTFQIASLLCLFALVAMQAFGPGRLYLCLCGDQAIIQSKATCEEAAQDCHSEEETKDGSDAPQMDVVSAGDWHHHSHHDHFAVRDELNAHSLAKVTVPEIAWVPLVPWFSDVVSDSITVPQHGFEARLSERAPPPASPLGRSFHLLI